MNIQKLDQIDATLKALILLASSDKLTMDGVVSVLTEVRQILKEVINGTDV